MGTIWIKEFLGGLDARRLQETTPGGVLVKATNGHISRGGEFEKRAAFVEEYQLPAGTVGIASGKTEIHVFGSGAAPAGIPSGVTYQRLQSGSKTLDRILSYDLYAGKLYVVAQFDDGSIVHFYDGQPVTDWFDGRARVRVEITGGEDTPPETATGHFDITGGTEAVGNSILSVSLSGVSLIGNPVDFVESTEATAAALANAITFYQSVPKFNAEAVGSRVIVTAGVHGSAPNGSIFQINIAGNIQTGNAVPMSGGLDAVQSSIDNMRINGVDIIGAAVNWSVGNAETAAALASAINDRASTPEYRATSVGAIVNIFADEAGTAANGRTVEATLSQGLTLAYPNGNTLAGGASSESNYTPGTYVRTIGSKVYSVAGPNLHFSGIKAPEKWTTDAVGAGAIDMSAESSGSEELQAVVTYHELIAVFAERVIQTWFVDPDPALNNKRQILNNTGTASPRSVTQFGDADIFYLDESGLRSLRARDSSNAAATTDIGVPVDPLVTGLMRGLNSEQRSRIIGLIEPRDGRFWLIFQHDIFVFSFFPGSNVSAWSHYTTTTQDDSNETALSFLVDDACVHRRRVYLRSGNSIYVYGGLGQTVDYDDTQAEGHTPYFDAGRPTAHKMFTGVDAAVRGVWDFSVGMDPNEYETAERVAVLSETTYSQQSINNAGESSHISLRFRSRGSGPALVSSAVIHYEGNSGDED